MTLQEMSHTYHSQHAALRPKRASLLQNLFGRGKK